MSVVILFLAVVGRSPGWWLSQQRLTAKPWLEEGPLGDCPGSDAVLAACREDRIGQYFSLSSAACSHC